MNSAFSGEVIPAWYELSLKGSHTLCVSVHRRALAEMQRIQWDAAPGVVHIKNAFRFPSFTKPVEGQCGFMDAFRSGASVHPDWIVWECKLPNIRSETGDERGANRVLAIRATLWLFFRALWLCKADTSWAKPQLMIIEDVCLPSDDRMGSAALSVTLMPPVMPWLSKHEDSTQIAGIVEAMKAASDHMWPGSMSHGRFEAFFRKPKRIDLSVPGDACSLNPDHSSNEDSFQEGYTLHPHNVDSSLQQLTFLAGLARLHDLARES